MCVGVGVCLVGECLIDLLTCKSNKVKDKENNTLLLEICLDNAHLSRFIKNKCNAMKTRGHELEIKKIKSLMSTVVRIVLWLLTMTIKRCVSVM